LLQTVAPLAAQRILEGVQLERLWGYFSKYSAGAWIARLRALTWTFRVGCRPSTIAGVRLKLTATHIDLSGNTSWHLAADTRAANWKISRAPRENNRRVFWRMRLLSEFA
jgi:hypothetical protein